jgi:hypothetical protein
LHRLLLIPRLVVALDSFARCILRPPSNGLIPTSQSTMFKLLLALAALVGLINACSAPPNYAVPADCATQSRWSPSTRDLCRER